MAKILIICNYDFTFNKFMIPLANKLMKEGHRVGVICDGNQINYERITGGEVTFHHIEIPRSASISGFISAIRAIKKIIKKHQYDIVNSNNRNTSFLARVALITMPFNNVKNVYTSKAITDVRKLVTEGYIKIERQSQDVEIAIEKAEV